MSALEQKVPEGYKQTEIGVIPKGWRVSSLSNCLENERIPSGLYKDKNLYGSGTSIIKLGDVFGNDFFKPERAQKVAATKNEISAYKVKIGDLIIALASVKLEGVGKVMLVDQLKSETIFDHNVALIRFKSNFNPTFMSYMLRSHWVRSLIASRATQVGTTFLKTSTILEFEVPLPDISEQTAIANALSDVDALLTELEKLIAKKQAIKTATMQQLLTGKTRLSQFATYTEGEEQGQLKGTKPSELGEIPEDWNVSTLGGAATFINGRAYALHEWETNGTPVIRLQNLTGRGADYYYSNLKLPEKQYCDNGDLLFMWSATFGPVIWKGEKAIYHYHIWKIENKEISDSKFLYFVLLDMTEKLKNSSSSGGTMLHITKGMMESTPCILPPKEEQTAIATILSDMDNEIQTLEQRLAKTRQIKQGMMQELLTGRTRLPFDKE